MTAIKKRIHDYYLDLMNCPGRINQVAGGFAIGVFIAFSPWVGLHTILVLLLTALFRRSIAAGVIGCMVFNPVTGLLIFTAEYEIGRLILDMPHVGLPEGISFELGGLAALWRTGAEIFYPLVLGSVILGVAASAISFALIRRSLAAYRDRVYLKRHGDEQDARASQ